MSDSGLRGNPLQVLFLAIGLGCLGFALWVAVADHENNTLSLLGSMGGRRLVMFCTGGAAAFLFSLVTIIHLKR